MYKWKRINNSDRNKAKRMHKSAVILLSKEIEDIESKFYSTQEEEFLAKMAVASNFQREQNILQTLRWGFSTRNKRIMTL